MQTDILKKKNENEYLTFDSTGESKELIKNIKVFGMELKKKIEAISSGEYDCKKDYTKIKFNSDDNLPLNKPLKFHLMTIIIRPAFEEDGKLYPQVF